MDRVRTRISAEKDFHKKTLITTLKTAYDKHATPFLYLQERAHHIVTSFLGQSQIFGAGFTKIVSQNNVPEEGIGKVVIVALMGQYAMTEIERYSHLFQQIFVVNLTISNQETKELIRVSPIKKKLVGFLEISLNFMPFIDSVYYSNNNISKQSKHQTNFEESLTAFLVSLSKFHEFKFSLLNKDSSKVLANSIKSHLQKKLMILETYKSKEYSSHSSPRIKVLVLQRKLDQMSPLLYSYHFGPISQEIKAFDKKNAEFTINSALYTALFPLDVQQANQFLTSVAQAKADNQKEKFQLHDFEKAKKVITTHYDQHLSPTEIELQIDLMKSIKQFCKRRAFTTGLQQTIINARSEADQQMTPGKIVDRILEWSTMPMTEYKPSEEDYKKIVILSYMVNSFWFWHRRILNAGFQKKQKNQIVAFCKKVEGKFKPLQQKPQGEERLDFYRHQPGIVQAARRWVTKDEIATYINFDVNESSVNKESTYVIAIKGPLGYGELALLIKQLKQADSKSEFLIFSESLVTTKQYLEIILNGQP